MNVSFQNTYISKRMNNQFVTDPKTGEKELSVNILLRGFENTRNNQKQNFNSPKVRNFDVFDYIIASDKRKNGEKIEIDEDGRLIINMKLEEYTEDGFRWIKDGSGWRMMSGFGSNGLLDIYEPYGFGTGQTDWMDKFSTNKYTKAEIIGHHIDMFHYVNPSMNFWDTKISYNQQVWKAYI